MMKTRLIYEMNNAFEGTIHSIRKCFIGGAFAACALLFVQPVEGNSAEAIDSNENLLQQYIQSKGAGIIVFDTSNIKQFWIEKSVISQKSSFDVLLETSAQGFESIPLKIQLANVNEAQDCRIEVIADANNDFSFSVLNSSLKPVSVSTPEENFLDYNVASSILHLEDTNNLSFNIKFHSKNQRSLAIKGIVLSFSNNKNSSYLVPPGDFMFNGKDVLGVDKLEIDEKDNSFTVSGKQIVVAFQKKIIVNNGELSCSATLKNTGDNPATVTFVYLPYTQKHQHVKSNIVPFGEKNTVVRVLSSEANSNKIIVDSTPEWEKGCYLVLNAKEDLSDFPNFSFVDGTISDVRKIDDGHTEITMDKPVKTAIQKGTTARVQAKAGASAIYVNRKQLNPGEEITISSQIRKDNNYLLYSAEAFCRGIYYVVPRFSINSNKQDAEIKVRIKDFTISH